ncbi:MAG TPA: hypothetical protein VMR90_04785 [Candidatus Cybelea sp.]|nr:hypothetical protein [Candidatus Cybelea sp.]
MNTANQRRTPTVPLLDLLGRLRAQRRRMAALSKKNLTLQTQGKRLVAESNCLAENVQRSCSNLVKTSFATRTAVSELRLRRGRTPGGTPLLSIQLNEPVLADSPDLVDALQQATELLKMEFSDTEGSGHQTLVKCEKVLERTRSTQTIVLPLY